MLSARFESVYIVEIVKSLTNSRRARRVGGVLLFLREHSTSSWDEHTPYYTHELLVIENKTTITLMFYTFISALDA